MADERTVWYRKWRPQTFSEITGQEHVTRTLRNAVAGKRTAHAYMLCGPRGTGKTTTARVLAKAVNCANPNDGEPCDRCESCVAVREGRALDLVEMDAASNRGIDDIRDLRDKVGYAASGGRFKVYLIDEVHELTQQAFDALLKTLEEPPPHVIFVLATTDAHRVPATILSRCQRFDLTRHRPADIVARLRMIADAEQFQIEDDALRLIARAATGALRDAVNMLEQLYASYGHTVTLAQAREGLGLGGDARALELAGMALAHDLAGGLSLLARVRDDGIDARQFCREVVNWLRGVLLVRAGVPDAVDVDADSFASLRALADTVEVAQISRALRAFGGADFRADPQASLPLELALVEVALGADTAASIVPAPAVASRPSTQRPAAPPPASPTRATPAASAPKERPRAVERTASPPVPVGVEGLSERLASVQQPGAGPANATPASATPAVPTGPPPSRASNPGRADGATPAPSQERSHVGSAADGGLVPLTSEDAVPGQEPTGAEAGSLTLAGARARYREVYETMRRLRPAAARLNPGDIIAVDAESITFALPYTIQVEKLAPGTEGATVLHQAVHAVFGRTYTVHCVHMPGVEDRLRAQPARPSHLLDEALKLGARPLSSS